MKLLCDIYKTNKKAELYLYLKHQQGFEYVPEQLLAQFGEPIKIMTLVLTPEKKLARADCAKVMQMLEEQGYYLQLPPSPYTAITESDSN